MIEVKIKPLSVNEVWQGKRYKTPAYTRYERDLLLILPKLSIPEHGPIEIVLEFAFSSKAADWDNPIKPFVDVLQKKYGFNDSRIHKATVTKTLVKKGLESIKFEIKQFGISG